jgi:hypothetical protein
MATPGPINISGSPHLLDEQHVALGRLLPYPAHPQTSRFAPGLHVVGSEPFLALRALRTPATWIELSDDGARTRWEQPRYVAQQRSWILTVVQEHRHQRAVDLVGQPFYRGDIGHNSADLRDPLLLLQISKVVEGIS